MERRPAHLLVVDDNQNALQTTVEFLTTHGYEVSTARDGQDALELTLRRIPDLVLFDIAMPGLDGWQVLAELRTRYAATELPVIMATAFDGGDDEHETYLITVRDYVHRRDLQPELDAFGGALVRPWSLGAESCPFRLGRGYDGYRVGYGGGPLEEWPLTCPRPRPDTRSRA